MKKATPKNNNWTGVSGITWTAPADKPGIGGRTFEGGRVIVKDGQAMIDFGMHQIQGRERRLLARIEGNPELAAAVEARKAELAEEEAREEARLASNVPGLKELEAAVADRDRYREEFARMMEDEDNDGVLPPAPENASASEMAKKYPRAALYLKAENHSFAAHWAKSKAGKEVMEFLAAGGEIEEARAKLENWIEDNNVYVD